MQDIIIVGKPNVGKSSLFNRMARKRIAITSDISGTTRDINKIEIQIQDKKALLIDSGGLDESSELFKNVKSKTLLSAKESKIILYLVDVKLGINEEDRKNFYTLARLKKPIALVINKVDNEKDKERAYEFASFGIKDVFFISVSHNVGLDELYDWLYKHLNKDESLSVDDDESLEDFLENDEIDEIDSSRIKVGILGRVNVGKSSLLNALLKEERSVVSKVAGTTIDPVNEVLSYKDKIIEFVDTAGIRKRGKIQGLEKFALLRTQEVLKQAQIALLVLDASEGFNELDERIAGLLAQNYLAVLIILNKWDKSELDFDKTVKELRLDRFKFLAHSPILSVSALSGKRVHLVLDKILELFENYIQKIPTAKLNSVVAEAIKAHPLPHDRGKLVKIYYATQYKIAPPKIALIMNRPKALHFSYKRYLQNKLRENFKLDGVPLIIASRKKGQKDEE
ncbi:ribosome biogenesis GTPase Der [Campylobacter avium]|uniref:ribosome biogenesis GTPase Der n=1 Tax=Campylobacter avium TaxID=522485 RepID=UPI0023549E8A|nr:ribosome biogenesis GTPase Der [Campylobacter avium]